MQHLIPKKLKLTHRGVNGEIKTRLVIQEHPHPYSQLRQAELIIGDLALVIAQRRYEAQRRARWHWVRRLWQKWISTLFNPLAAAQWEEMNAIAKQISEAEEEDAIAELAVAHAERSRILQEFPELADPSQRLELEQSAYYRMLASNFLAENLASAKGLSLGYAQRIVALPEKDRQAFFEEYNRQVASKIDLFFPPDSPDSIPSQTIAPHD